MVLTNTIKEINTIPILEVAPLVVPKFHFKGKTAIGQCIFHEDNILNNLKFNVEKNYAHCFTCSRTWSVYKLVKEFGHFNSVEQVVQFLNKQGYQIKMNICGNTITANNTITAKKIAPWKNLLKNYFILYSLEDDICNQIIEERTKEYKSKIDMIYNQLIVLYPQLKSKLEQEKKQLLQLIFTQKKEVK